jgi:hypothetical protein
MSKARLEAFSDGVIAVAITLLALDLTVPEPGHGELLTQLGDHWPQFAAYASALVDRRAGLRGGLRRCIHQRALVACNCGSGRDLLRVCAPASRDCRR